MVTRKSKAISVDIWSTLKGWHPLVWDQELGDLDSNPYLSMVYEASCSLSVNFL